MIFRGWVAASRQWWLARQAAGARSSKHAAGTVLFRPGYRIWLKTDAGEDPDVARLLHRMYATRGYRSDTDALGPFPAAAAADATLGASSPLAVFGTLGVRMDSPAGLHADELYKQEIDEVRSEGGKVCEFIRFAVDASLAPLGVLGSLFHIAYLYAHDACGATDVFVEVNPRHSGFYQRMLGFTRVGKEKRCPRVGAPAVLMHLRLAAVASNIRRHRMNPIPGRGKLYRYAIGAGDEQHAQRRIRAIFSRAVEARSRPTPTADNDTDPLEPTLPVGDVVPSPPEYASRLACCQEGVVAKHLELQQPESSHYDDGVKSGFEARARREAIGTYHRIGVDAFALGFRAGYYSQCPPKFVECAIDAALCAAP